MVRNLNHDIVISATFHSNCKTYSTSCLCDDALLNYHNHDKKIIYQKKKPNLGLDYTETSSPLDNYQKLRISSFC